MQEEHVSLLDERRLGELLERHRAFWTCAPVDRPLVRVTPTKPRRETQVPGEALSITPETIRAGIERTVQGLEAHYKQVGVLNQDLFNADPFPAPPWLEAVVGCPIKVFSHTYTYWREPLPGGLAQALRLVSGVGDPRVGTAWREALVAQYRAACERLGARYPLGNPLLRAPVDCLAAMIGDEALCYLLFEQPEALKQVADVCADLWIALTRAWVEVAVPFAGGYFNQWHLWAPGPTTTFTVDASNLLSPRIYRELFLPFDRRLAESVPYPVIHVHAEALHQVDGWLDIPNLAIEIDDGCIPVEEGWTSRTAWPGLLEKFKEIQAHGRPLVLSLTKEHADEVLQTLSPCGLLLMVNEWTAP